MNTILTLRSISLAALLTVAGSACALSIGPVSGSTVIGRPLELTAPIRFDDLAQAGQPCVSADLVYGDTRVESSKVKLNVTHDGARQASIARISSTALVNEPVVTLVLRAGCGPESTRRYVLLAEAPRDGPAIAVDAAPVAAAAPAAALSLRAEREAAAPRRVRQAPTAGATERPARVRRATASAEPIQRKGSRLQLAVWEPGVDERPWLRVSSELVSRPSMDGAQRAAAVALWQALNAQPQDLLRTADRLRFLEGEMSALRTLSSRHRSEISGMRNSLQAAQSQRYTNLLLAACLALLAGGASAFFWNRSRRADALGSHASWYPPLEPEDRRTVQEPIEEVLATSVPQAAPEPVVQRTVAPVALHAFPPAAQDAPWRPDMALEFTPVEIPHAAPTVAPIEHRPGLKVDALQAAQQQAAFFSSLGQFDEAVSVLSAYIDESSEKPVLAFLELFRIYHGLGMRVEYEDLQSRFRHTFGFDVPGFSTYKDDCRELETYPAAISRIAASWPSVQSQDTIEGLAFRRPGAARDLLSVEAYRELLWLYGLAQDIVRQTGSPAGLQLLEDRGLPNNHFILPWAGGEEHGPTELSLDRLDLIDVAAGSSGFGVDIDLTALPGESLQQSWQDVASVILPEPGKEAAEPGTDVFDSVMEAQSRKLFR